jgi:hypothetical protein
MTASNSPASTGVKSLLISLCLLTACSGTTHVAPGHAPPAVAPDITLRDLSRSDTLRFRLERDGETFVRVGLSHTKEMHLLGVRDDLTQFVHLHPERNEQGEWVIPFAASQPGSYRFYADFVTWQDEAYTLRFDRVYGAVESQKNVINWQPEVTTKTTGNFQVRLEKSETRDNVMYRYIMTTLQGNSVTAEPYLGALGHSVLLTEDGGYIHAHALDTEATPTFIVSPKPTVPMRAFTQVQVEGAVQTFWFDV